MNLKRLIAFAVALWVSLIGVLAEPLNVVVGDLTFARPEPWVFAPPSGLSPSTSRFILPEENATRIGDIRFYFPGKTPSEAEAHWKTFLANEDVDTFQVNETVIGKRKITYVRFHGTVKLPGEKRAKDVGFIGAVLPSGEQSMHIRFTGPHKVVEKWTPAFKKMIEDAVRESEAERSDK